MLVWRRSRAIWSWVPRADSRACLAGSLQDVDLHTVTLLAGRGGSLLRSSREPVLGKADARERLLAALSRHKIDNLLLFGGDGTIPLRLASVG